MKWLVLVAVSGSVLPLAFWLRDSPERQLNLFALISFLPFVLSVLTQLDIALISWRTWLGFTHGIEVTAIDVLALALLISLPPAQQPLPFRFVFSLYVAAILISIFQADVPLAASFYAWQFLRMFLLFAVISRACAGDIRVPSALLKGMAAGLIMQSLIAVWQRYGLGAVQTHGTFVHQNTLGMVAHMVALPLFALLLAGHRRWHTLAAPLSAALIAVLTASRAAIGLIVLGLGLVLMLSGLRRWTVRKAVITILGLLLVASLAPLAVSSFERRFAATPFEQDYGERAAFNRAAALMLRDHPMGVGANHYVIMAKNHGYSERAGVIAFAASRNAHVHNAFWLAAAETGYVGLGALLLLMLRPLGVAFADGWRYREDLRGDLLLGLGAALLMVYIHSLFEWILFTSQVQYLFVIAVGMVAGCAQQLRGTNESGRMVRAAPLSARSLRAPRNDERPRGFPGSTRS